MHNLSYSECYYKISSLANSLHSPDSRYHLLNSTPNPGLIFANWLDTGNSWSWELLPILVGLLQAAPISGPASPFQS